MSYPNLSALLEAIVYVANEPVSRDAIQKALPEPIHPRSARS
jgi:chromosome segregation and condensation protein ScpB